MESSSSESVNEGLYVIIPHPRKPAVKVKGKVLKIVRKKEEWNEYELEDGIIIRIGLTVNHIAVPIDPETNEVIINPETGEPIFNANWNVRVMALYREDALEKFLKKTKKK